MLILRLSSSVISESRKLEVKDVCFIDWTSSAVKSYFERNIFCLQIYIKKSGLYASLLNNDSFSTEKYVSPVLSPSSAHENRKIQGELTMLIYEQKSGGRKWL